MNKLEYIKQNYLKNGFKIFPVKENEKTPLINEWQNECSSDFLQVVYWLEQAKNCNIGLPANENNLFVIDLDMHGDINGVHSYVKLLNDLDISIDDGCDTKMQATPSGGIHFIFKSDDELKEVMNSANCFKGYPGIDIRTKGYILVQPSVIDGKEYSISDTEIKEIPPKLKEFILKNDTKEKEIRKEYVKPIVVEKGGRDSSLFDYLNQLYYKTRLNKEEIRLLAYHFNQVICDPPLSNGVVDYKVDKLFKKKRNKYILVNLSDEQEEEN